MSFILSQTVGAFWDKPPVPELDPSMPTSLIVCCVMWFLHGFMLDIVIIGVLPVLTGAKSADAMFYNGKSANLNPTVCLDAHPTPRLQPTPRASTQRAPPDP